MADVGVFAKNADIQARAGINANATAKATAATDVYILDIEAKINVTCGVNFSDTFSTLNADVKGLLRDTAACKAAMVVIIQDPSGFQSLAAAQTALNVLQDTYVENIAILSKSGKTDFISRA